MKIIIARHGNTFESGETPRRVGARSDIPLTEKGYLQGDAIGRYLKAKNLQPDIIIHGPLIRHKQTAEWALQHLSCPIEEDHTLNEIDYGPDENKTDADVNARLGEEALKLWDAHGHVPEGWQVNPTTIQENWRTLLAELSKKGYQRPLIVTSNGTARFLLKVVENAPDGFLKLGTGRLGFISQTDTGWYLDDWHVKPDILNIKNTLTVFYYSMKITVSLGCIFGNCAESSHLNNQCQYSVL